MLITRYNFLNITDPHYGGLFLQHKPTASIMACYMAGAIDVRRITAERAAKAKATAGK